MNFTPFVITLACAAPQGSSAPTPSWTQAKTAPAPAPVVSVPSPGPLFGKPGSGVLATPTAPNFGTPTSSGGGSYGTPQPGPVFGTPDKNTAPNYGTPQPGGVSTPQPGSPFGTPTSSGGGEYGTPQPGPVFGTPDKNTAPTWGTPQPGGVVSTPQPGSPYGTPTSSGGGEYGTPQPGSVFGNPGGGPMPGPGTGKPDPNGDGYGVPVPGPDYGTPSRDPFGSADGGSTKPGSDFGGAHTDYRVPSPHGPGFGETDGIEQAFRFESSEETWGATLRVRRIPDKLKGVVAEVVVSTDWMLQSESLSSETKPPMTDVALLGRSTVRFAEHELFAAAAAEHELQTEFDGHWDWKGASGETSVTSAFSEVMTIELPPSVFEGQGFVRIPILGTQQAMLDVDGSEEVATQATGHSDVSVRIRFIQD
jgi:hypothetical protein